MQVWTCHCSANLTNLANAVPTRARHTTSHMKLTPVQHQVRVKPRSQGPGDGGGEEGGGGGGGGG